MSTTQRRGAARLPRQAIPILLAQKNCRARVYDAVGTRVPTFPEWSATIGDQIDALRRVAGDKVVDLICEAPDPAVHEIVSSWPRAFSADRARSLGFTAESSMDEIIEVHIEDELGGAPG